MAQTILIADDFKEYAGLLEKNLQAAGFQTVAVYDGESALQAVRAKKPDLILLDIMMPNTSGTEVRNELMKDPSTRSIPIVFLTGLRAPHSTKKPSIDGVKVVGKSKDFSEILGAIREMLPKQPK
jgi:CheY-like chemotaxis protein